MGLQRERTGELGSQKGRGVIVSLNLFLANTGVMQNVFTSLENGFRKKKRAWGSNERILPTFLHCFLTST